MNRATCAALALAGCLLAPMAQAASFDCDAARTDVERAICADDQLGREDELLAEAYRTVYKEVPVADRAGLLREQRAWLRQRNACVVDGRDGAGCLLEAMQTRRRELDARLTHVRATFDKVVASIPVTPGTAARELSGYGSSLAQAWLLYLVRHAPHEGQLLSRAPSLRKQAREALRETDVFAASVLDDVYAAGSDDAEAEGDMTLLRMWIERSYDGGRAYVHCFVFHRQPALAFGTMGALYGSTRDGDAPVCDPEGDLFDSAQWSRLHEAFEPAVAVTHGMDSGTIRFADFAQWRLRALELTVAPLDFLDPPQSGGDFESPEQAIADWKDDDAWPPDARAEAITALAAVRRITIDWLRTQRGLDAGQAAKVAEAYLRGWVHGQLSYAGESL